MATATEALIGRETDVELLAASLEAAAEGHPRFLFVVGEAGIGKTRLLREAADAGWRLGLRVLEGTAVQGGRALPYLPLLASLAKCVDGEDDPSADIVRRVITGEPSPDVSDGADTARVLESIFTLVAREPTVLVVDDAQWADTATVTALDYISHRAHAEALAVVVAARDDDRAMIASLPFGDGRRFTTLTVRRLSFEEVAEQVKSLLGRQPEPDLVSAFFERSAGNPFFVEQLLAVGPRETPASLRALVLSRLAELSQVERLIVDALAVLGRAADEAFIAEVAGVTEVEAGEAARVAASRGIAVVADDGLTFRHPLFAEVVLADLSASMRRRLHRRAAEALEASGAAAGEIARHWWEARDHDRARSAALEAAGHAEQSFAFSEARLNLERALEVWPQAEPRSECLLRAARAAWLAGDPASAVELVQRARAEGAPDDAELQIALGRYAAEAGRLAVSDAAFEHAAAVLKPDDPDATRAFALAGLARARINQGRYADARGAAEAAMKFAYDAADPWAEGAARTARGMTYAFEGSLAGIPDLEQCIALASHARSPPLTGRAHEFLALLLHLAGDLERALAVSLAGVEACQALGVARTHGADLRGRAALIRLELGRWDDADAILAPAEERALPVLARALLAMRRGHVEHAQQQIDAVIGGPAIGAPDSMLYLLPAELAWLRGDTASARASLQAMPSYPGLWGASAAADAERLAGRLAADDPRHSVPLSVAQARHPDSKLNAALRAELAAETTRRSGATDPELWSVCTVAWLAACRPYDRAYARLREAEALFSAGARDRAKEALRDAAAASSALGARPLRALADDLARRARVSPERPRRRDSHQGEPTGRELDVLALLAEGLTNREIAARLFLSPKTVGIHVSRLHQKLDAHTRGEAVAVARRRGILV